MAVRIRMKMMGRKHRQYFRIVAIDSRQPRDGRVLEELGSYDPQVRNPDECVRLNPDRIVHWLSVGAQPSENVQVLLDNYLAPCFVPGAVAATQQAAQQAAQDAQQAAKDAQTAERVALTCPQATQDAARATGAAEQA